MSEEDQATGSDGSGEERAVTRGPAGLEKESVWEVYYPRGVDRDKEAVPVASFPMIVYFWPSVLTLLTCGLLQAFSDEPSPALGLVTVGVWTFNLLVIVSDLDQKKFLITVLVFALLGLGAWIAHREEFGLPGAVLGWIAALDVTLSTDAYFVMGSILLVLFVVGLAQPRFDYWRLEANEFVHYIQPWGRDQSVPRLGSTVSREVPDILEYLLTFGGGTLLIRREGQVVARIEHVPFLGRRMIAIERLLGATRVKTVSES